MGNLEKGLLLKIKSRSQFLRATVHFVRAKHQVIILKFCNLVIGQY